MIKLQSPAIESVCVYTCGLSVTRRVSVVWWPRAKARCSRVMSVLLCCIGRPRAKAGEEPDELGLLRSKLLNFLQSSKYYLAERLISQFPHEGEYCSAPSHVQLINHVRL